jgi:glycosyltransferase involved in cell wall biosynthesis
MSSIAASDLRTETRKHAFWSTLWFPAWQGRVRAVELPYPRSGPHALYKELITLARILRSARRERVLMLNSSSGVIYPDLLACMILGFLPRRYRAALMLVGEMWEPNTGLRGLFERLATRLVDRAVDRYVVYSQDDKQAFCALWGIDPDKVGVALCYYHLSAQELEGPPPPNGTHIFAGGDSGRDYAPLVEAARQFPDTRFILATAWTSPKPVPPNVDIVLAKRTNTSHAEFIHLLRTARATVVPLQQGMKRSVGQQTYLNSLYLGKPTLVARALGLSDHVEDGEHALVVDGTASGYVGALTWLLDPQNQNNVTAMAERGRIRAASFTSDRLAADLLRQAELVLRKYSLSEDHAQDSADRAPG